MKEWVLFIASVTDELLDLYLYAREVARDAKAVDAERERQLAMRLIRAAVDDAARREISGP